MNSVYTNVAGGGLDVHYKFSSVTMRDAEANIVRRERLAHRDRARLRQVLSSWPKDVPLVMEASFGWGWLAQEMKEQGLTPVLSNCFKVEQMRKAHGVAKTNKKDADLLSLLPFEAKQWWRVWMAPPEVRDRREWMRYRSDLVSISTAVRNRIHAVFHRHGVFHDFTDLFGSKGRAFLVALCTDGKTPDMQLSPAARAVLAGNVRLLDFVRKELAKVAAQLRGELERSDVARRLDSIPGIGLILAHTLMAEIGEITRFRNCRALACYSLLAPMSNDTGEDDGRAPLGRRLGQRGNRTLKWAMIEAAHGAVKKGGRWREMFDNYTDGGKKDRNRGYIKVARELVKIVYVVWRKNVSYQENPPARPGRDASAAASGADRNSRSGTGQSCTAMVAGR